jgi:hypothetical protein
MTTSPLKIAVALALLLTLCLSTACKKNDGSSGSSGGSANAGDSSGISGTGDSDAVAASRDELAKHWVSTPDGWISEFPSKVFLATGKRSGPESYYRQIKELKFEVESRDLSDSDKLNGAQFRGYCTILSAPMRLYNDPNSFGGKTWSPWKQSDVATSAFYIEKVKGQWKFNGDSFAIGGTPPAPATISQLK